uniref:Endonuclease V n=1 Tax=Caldiarchaeum subterraneum TaxID=311458 RepID=E6N2P2_CALS0|nr:endonuclease V [Candidatus Caldarchaeum subterraneum]
MARIAYPVEDRLGVVERVCGVDAAYRRGRVAAAAVVYDVGERRVVEDVVEVIAGKTTPYIPGFLVLREGPAMLRALQRTKTDYDVLVADGHGRAHPRRCGLATLLGFAVDKPSIGVAKSILIGTRQPSNSHDKIVEGDEVIGVAKGKTVYSQGYGVSFNDLLKVFDLFGGAYPEPLRVADRLSREAVKKL